ncbi:MAG: adenine nucleotide alpha hydrolase family protein [Aeropyrum sp.]|nr:adenine nucleotide alpha hydrolase family protein [Aeropyrum sp.]
MAKCSVCQAPAVAYVRVQRRYLCRQHYLEYVEAKVERAIRRYGMVGRGQRVLAAVSGGKDSSTLLATLSRLSGRLGFELIGFYIHLGIYDYSEKSRRAAEELAAKLGVPLLTLDLREVLGMGIPELAKTSRRPYCSVCGSVKRYVINAAAVELGADAVALGHNADDIAVYNMKSFLSQDLEAISKLGAKTDTVEGVAVGRIRPLYLVYEKESFLYSLLSGLPFLHEECPFVDRRQLEVELKEAVNRLEDKSPGIKMQMVTRLAKRIGDYPRPRGEVSRCPSCGLISSGGECSFCRITRRALGRPMGMEVRRRIRALAAEMGLLRASQSHS